MNELYKEGLMTNNPQISSMNEVTKVKQIGNPIPYTGIDIKNESSDRFCERNTNFTIAR